LDVLARHFIWKNTRRDILAALLSDPLSATRASRFAWCGYDAWVQRSNAPIPAYRIVANYCHDRMCLPCQATRSRQLAARIAPMLQGHRLRFLTLTIAHTPDPLKDQLNRLTRWFRRLRSTPLWRSAVTGGIAILEVKRSTDGHSWHPHLHCLLLGHYIPQGRLSAAWLRITRTSYYVHIERVDDAAQAVRYVTTYASKPLQFATGADLPALLDAIDALRHRRLVVPFGLIKAIPRNDRDDALTWTILRSLTSLLQAAAAGDAQAAAILGALQLQTPYLASPQLILRPRVQPQATGPP
jgi:hypothetical protein